MTDPAPSKSGRSPVMVALGWLLVILGGLWTALTGLCTLAFLGSGLASPSAGGASIAPVALVMGLPSIAPGVLMLWGGVAILREQRRLAAAKAAETFD